MREETWIQTMPSFAKKSCCFQLCGKLYSLANSVFSWWNHVYVYTGHSKSLFISDIFNPRTLAASDLKRSTLEIRGRERAIGKILLECPVLNIYVIPSSRTTVLPRKFCSPHLANRKELSTFVMLCDIFKINRMSRNIVFEKGSTQLPFVLKVRKF